MRYTAKRVSPGDKLELAWDSEYDLSAHQMLDKGLKLVREHYKEIEANIIDDFTHFFVNHDPKYAIIVICINLGYGLAIVNYESFIVKKNK